jgi:hypothetical protein
MAQTRLETRLTARDETARAFRTLNASLNTANAAFARVAAVAAGLGAVFGGVFVRDLLNVNREFQSLKASLITFTGSIENADGAFRILRDFAKTTPFSLAEVVSSFNILVAQGIRPTEKQLTSFADIAGGTSKSIEQFAEAVADATVGEFERLKEFGIRASKEGNQLTLAIGNYTKTINNDSDSILAALAEIGDLQFAGGAARQAATLGGAITNLRDTVDEFLFSIGEQGFAGELSKAIKIMSDMISGNEDLARSISQKMTTALYAAVAAVRFLVDNLDTLLLALKTAFALAIIQRIITTGKAIIDFGKAVVKSQLAVAAFTTLMKLTKGNLALIAAGAATAALVYSEFQEEIDGVIGALADNISLGRLEATVLDALGLSASGLEDRFNELAGEIEGTNENFLQNNSTILDFIPTIGEAGAGMDGAAGSAASLDQAMKNVKRAIDPVGTALSELTTENAVLKKAVASGNITQEQAIQIMNRMSREALGLDTTLDDLRDRQLKVEAAFKAGVLTTAEYRKAISDIKGEIIDYNAENQRTYGAGAIKGIKDYYQSISDNAKNATTFVAGAFGGLEKSLSDFFYTGDLNFGTFVDAIKRGLADLAAKAVISVGLNFLGKVFPNLAFADGGLVPGSGGPRADNVLARVSSGEYVIKASSVSKFGTGFFDALNAGQMPAMGGGGFSIDAGLMESLTPGFFLGKIVKAIGNVIKGVADAIGNVVRGVVDAITSVVGAISNAVRGLVDAIVGGDLLSIASFALPFILPGVGAAIAGNLAAGSGFIGAVGSGISSSFAAGVMGSGNLAAIAQSVGIEFAKGAVIDKMSDTIATNVLGITGNMASAGGAYEQARADRFGRLYNDAAPYLAGMTGARFNAGDNVRVGERGEELLIPGRNGSVAPIKGSANDLIDVVKDMKEEIVMLRRQMSRVIAGGQLSGARS